MGSMTQIVPLVTPIVNSGTRCTSYKRRYYSSMTRKEPRKAKIEPIHVEESEALARLFKQHSKLSQAAFGAEYDLGTQGNVWQYLKARSPLNISAAVKFANGLGVDVRDFSPRLADEIDQLIEGVPDTEAGSDAWPFKSVSQAKIVALTPKQILDLEAALMDAAFRVGVDILKPREPKRVTPPRGRKQESTG